MGNNTQSSGQTPVTGSTPDDLVHKNQLNNAINEAKEKAEEIVNIVAESVMPPGTHLPRRKK